LQPNNSYSRQGRGLTTFWSALALRATFSRGQRPLWGLEHIGTDFVLQKLKVVRANA
jgi:hypothetical protein